MSSLLLIFSLKFFFLQSLLLFAQSIVQSSPIQFELYIYILHTFTAPMDDSSLFRFILEKCNFLRKERKKKQEEKNMIVEQNEMDPRD